MTTRDRIRKLRAHVWHLAYSARRRQENARLYEVKERAKGMADAYENVEAHLKIILEDMGTP